jgi:peptide-methionine (S)-S-oxide reductase
VEAVFNRLRGVSNVVSGFAGGNKGTAHYDIVSTGTTGHAESVKITHDPSEISYGKLLEVFFSVAYDPTELNRQGPGHRHAVSIRDFLRLGRADTRNRSPIVTEVTPLNGFYAAEDHHQHFLDHNPTNPYIVYNDLPKLERLKQQFPELLKHR